jgi:HPt (histidine-containing phosphotransfer) domain-containing protein
LENEPSAPLLDLGLVAEIRRIEQATGRTDVLSGFVRRLEGHIAAFPDEFSRCLSRGDFGAAVRAAHTLKGTCHQLGAVALGRLFADIESTAKAGDYVAARQQYDGGAALIAQSLDALKKA